MMRRHQGLSEGRNYGHNSAGLQIFAAHLKISKTSQVDSKQDVDEISLAYYYF